MEYQELAPPPPLDEVVHCFWFLRDPDGGAAGAPPQTVVPDGRLEIVIHLAEPFAFVDGAGVHHRQAPVLIGGQLTSPIRLAARGPSDVVGIRFRTDGARRVLPFPLAEVTGGVVPLAELLPRLAGALADAAASREEAAARAGALSRILGRTAHVEASPVLSSAVRSLGAPRAPRLEALARELGVSVRTLERRVRDEVGLSPRDLRRVLRFRRAFRLLDGTPQGAWTRVALAAGYFDQAHLIRDFRRLAGAPPSAFFQSDPDL
ncbi:MAG TPA: helix-turn-helix domain-containing protein, partial [Gemmatimonadaceae bacterium]|nr:helix-turn-helix domain-containing protein [Gemmatimonadaceae bacterium]